MAYFLDLFSPETYEAFSRSKRDVSGFRIRQKNAASKIQEGDKLICYITRLSRWIGILEVKSRPYIDDEPIFYGENDPFVVRFKVNPLIWLEKEKAIPIHEDKVWNSLSFTKRHDKKTSTWTGKIRASLTKFDEADGAFLENIIIEQEKSDRIFKIDESGYKKLKTHRVRRPEGEVSVSVPEDLIEEEPEELKDAETKVRESIIIQSLVAQIGAKMGMKIWIPRNDRGKVLEQWGEESPPLLETLPLNYDDTTLQTIEQIDVLWLRGRAIIRAFEVEHTTSIYSGILRMADLLALQPNMNIKLHIVAPISRKDKVFTEIRRPVFSLLEKGPLAESCTYISYESVTELSKQKLLKHLVDSVLDEYAEVAE